jgi:hypothetical protein
MAKSMYMVRDAYDMKSRKTESDVSEDCPLASGLLDPLSVN